MLGNLLYNYFPFPPIVWRFIFVLLAFFAVIDSIRTGKLCSLEKSVLLFVLLNLLHFFLSFLWLDTPSTSYLGNILYAMLALHLFTWLGRKNVLSDKFIMLITCIFSFAGILYFYHAQQLVLTKLIANREETTVNATTIFLVLIPFLFFIRNKLLSYFLLILYWLFLLQGAKRGNIVAAIMPTILYLYYTLKETKLSLGKIILGIIVIGFIVNFFIEQIQENEYLLGRIESLVEGDSSGRDNIYGRAWHVWYDSMNVFRYLFGFGFQGCLYQIGIMAHNDWLEILVNYGLIGVLIYLYVFYSVFRLYLNEYDRLFRYVLFVVICIWGLKSLYSMGFVEELTAFLFIPFAKCLSGIVKY